MVKMIAQKTIKHPVSFTGVALHTGEETSIRLLPGRADAGYCFRRVDKPGAPLVKASVDNVVDTLLSTNLMANGASVKTVEHLLSALAGTGVDDAVIEVAGSELPILDGSALPFVEGIERAGLRELAAPKRMIRILEPISAGNGSGLATFDPCDSSTDHFRLDFVIEFDHPAIGRQELGFVFSPAAYRREVAFARTFGFARQVEELRRSGLARGGSLDNAVVLDDRGVLNPGGLRAPDEFVRHKVLDTIGDLSLLGVPILGAYRGYRAGHALNRLLGLEVLAHPERWELVTVAEGGGGQALPRSESISRLSLGTATA
jgi:UDP-3-O-[3-hydroxymyristoyl] N-acetylglucosamine deacetylase